MKASRNPSVGIVSNQGGEQRLIGRVAARLHAAHLDVALDSETAYSDWLDIGQLKRDYWERLAREVVLNFNDDDRWAVSITS